LPLQPDTSKKAATNRQLVATLLPLLHESKIRLEVLCLGLVGSQSENIHSGFRAYTDQSAFQAPTLGNKEQGHGFRAYAPKQHPRHSLPKDVILTSLIIISEAATLNTSAGKIESKPNITPSQ
jgi:hypothetical protein